MTTVPTDPGPEASARALVFLHVPKTAGSTLKWIIQRQFPPDRTLVIEGEELHVHYKAFQAQPVAARQHLRCVIGHVPYGMHRWLPQGARYITMLRDPVEWTLSLHSYVRRMSFFDSNPDLAAFRGARDLALDGFVEFLVRSNMGDMQTRALSGQIDVTSFLPPYAPLTADALDCAKRNLHASFECIGIVERFDESLMLMKRKLGWRSIYYRRLNESEGRSARAELPRATLGRIRECNRRDVELYDQACRLLSAEIEAGGEAFRKQLHRFQRNNAIYSRLLPIYEASGLHRVRRALRRGLEAIR